MNPILAERNGTIIAGHGRWQAAKDLGLGHVPVLRFEHLTDEIRAYRPADNRLAELSGWSDDIIAIQLQHPSSSTSTQPRDRGLEQTEIDILLDPPSADKDEAGDRRGRR